QIPYPFRTDADGANPPVPHYPSIQQSVQPVGDSQLGGQRPLSDTVVTLHLAEAPMRISFVRVQASRDTEALRACQSRVPDCSDTAGVPSSTAPSSIPISTGF